MCKNICNSFSTAETIYLIPEFSLGTNEMPLFLSTVEIRGYIIQ